jgi:hypothetical protein
MLYLKGACECARLDVAALTVELKAFVELSDPKPVPLA